MNGPAPGLVVAAPASASGKTVVTLGLARAFRRLGVEVATFKAGPDYIDPAYLGAASGRSSVNLDPWAMRSETIVSLARALGDHDLVLGEGTMGLFDGAADGTGSTADLAAFAGWPILLVVDARGQAGSAAALVRGFAGHRGDIRVAGVIFNRTGGGSHEEMLRRALAPLEIPVLGCLPRDGRLALPSRHLGLVQAGERDDLEAFLDDAADRVAAHVDLAAIRRAAVPPASLPRTAHAVDAPLPPLGQRIAVAKDAAFSFIYPALIEGWRRAGAEIAWFSPLADEAPPAADAVYLPGGYPELHARTLAAAGRFMAGLRAAAAEGAVIFGECGGYMALGRGLVDAEGRRHAMAGLLPLETGMAERRLQLGYRRVELIAAGPLGAAGAAFRGHEFHYATVADEGAGEPLFHSRDSLGRDLGSAGRRIGRVFGSFIHLIDREAALAGAAAA